MYFVHNHFCFKMTYLSHHYKIHVISKRRAKRVNICDEYFCHSIVNSFQILQNKAVLKHADGLYTINGSMEVKTTLLYFVSAFREPRAEKAASWLSNIRSAPTYPLVIRATASKSNRESTLNLEHCCFNISLLWLRVGTFIIIWN